MCYRYKVDQRGKLKIYLDEATHVVYIFERFAAGDSLEKISDALFLMDILSPTGKEIWSKETISKILSNSNEKYTGDIILGKTQVKSGVQAKTNDLSTRTILTSHHSAIISKELFDSVRKEKASDIVCVRDRKM